MASWDFGALGHQRTINPEDLDGSSWSGDLSDREEQEELMQFVDYLGSGEPYPLARQGTSSVSFGSLSPGDVNAQPAPDANVTAYSGTNAARNDATIHEHNQPSRAHESDSRPQERSHFRPWEPQPSMSRQHSQNTQPTPLGTHPPRQAQAAINSNYTVDSSSDTASNEDMPPTTRRRPARQTSLFVDITDITDTPATSSTRPTRTRKRKPDNAEDDGSATKRKKPAPAVTVNIDDDEGEAPSADAELLKAQQLDALKAQQARDDGPVRIGKRTCIICLENYTNATTSSCGHIFCHECLTRALMAGEKNNERSIGNCPACRKPINRKKGNTLIPINFLKKSAFAKKGRQSA